MCYRSFWWLEFFAYMHVHFFLQNNLNSVFLFFFVLQLKMYQWKAQLSLISFNKIVFLMHRKNVWDTNRYIRKISLLTCCHLFQNVYNFITPHSKRGHLWWQMIHYLKQIIHQQLLDHTPRVKLQHITMEFHYWTSDTMNLIRHMCMSPSYIPNQNQLKFYMIGKRFTVKDNQ